MPEVDLEGRTPREKPASRATTPAPPSAISARFVTYEQATRVKVASCHELSIVISGSAEKTASGVRATIAAGDAFVSPPEQSYELRSVRRLVIAQISFDAERDLPRHELSNLLPLEPLLEPQGGRLRVAPRQLGVVFDAVKRLKQECEQLCLGQELLLGALFYELLVVLARAADAGDDDPERYRSRLSVAISYLHEHFRDALSVEQLAEAAGISPARFEQVFRHVYGTSPLDYMAALRMREARDLLRDERRSISEVAFDVGYHDHQYFSRAFKQQHGLTPREFRQLARIGTPSTASSAVLDEPQPGRKARRPSSRVAQA